MREERRVRKEGRGMNGVEGGARRRGQWRGIRDERIVRRGEGGDRMSNGRG